MPLFKFRCVSKQGDTYDIERPGDTYDQARDRAVADGHTVLPVQPSSMVSGSVESQTFGHILTDATPHRGGRDSAQILESIDAKLSEVLRFTKLARIVLIVMICFWILGFCIWATMALSLFGGLFRFGR